MRDVAIVACARTPIGRAFRGALNRCFPFEKGIIGGQVGGGLLGNHLLLLGPEGHVEGLCDASGNIRLDLEYIGERRIELLSPLTARSLVRAHVHQLGAHPDPARASRGLFPLHGRGEQVVDAQLARDLLLGLRGPAVLV